MSESLPAHAPVVVIGGGIVGCSTLYHLAKMGVSDAILLERNRLTSGTTWHSAAQVRALRHSRNLTRMIQYSGGTLRPARSGNRAKRRLDPEGLPVDRHDA